MSKLSIVCSPSEVPLKPAPITPEWILDGAPVARNRELSHSRDWGAWTMVWDCTAGRFQWHYDIDETVHFVEGNVTIVVRRNGRAPVWTGRRDLLSRWFHSNVGRGILRPQGRVLPQGLPAPLLLLQKVYGRVRKLFARSGDSVGALSPAA